MNLRILLFLFGASGCAAPDTTGIKLIGHGGLGPNGDFPMDSREAIFGALTRGMDGVEMDVQLTKDSVLVLFHDLELTGANGCKGVVNSTSWDALRLCQEGVPYSIERLDNLLFEAAGLFPNAEFTFDIKLNTKGEWWPYLRTFGEAVRDLIEHPVMKDRIVIECQTADFLRTLHTMAPDVPLFLYGNDPGMAIPQAAALGCAGITMESDRLSAADIAAARQRGLQVTLFGVSGTADLRTAAAKKPDRIQLDHDR